MPNRIRDDPYYAPAEVLAMMDLHRAGWSVGDFASRDTEGRLTWVVSGSNGENLLRVEGTTKDEASGRAVESARMLGMLGRSSH